MIATEQLGRLFEFELEMFSDDPNIDLNQMLGKNVTVTVPIEWPTAQGNGTRYFNGFVTRFSNIGKRKQGYFYRATLSPWLWFLTCTADCRIFQNKSVPDIIRSICSNHGFDNVRKSLNNDYHIWDYCVQYRETDFNFISRLMEQEGIYYYFVHENNHHILVLADNLGSHASFPNYDEVPYCCSQDNYPLPATGYLYEWIVEKQVQPGSYALNDFDFIAPRKDLRTESSMPNRHEMAKFQMYDYPGEYREASRGNTYSKIRLEEFLSQHEIMYGEGIARGLAAGYLFNLTSCERKEQNRQYLVVSAVYHLNSANEYSVRITAIDANQQYRSPRITPKPVVQGPQTAIVVGAPKDEIYTDKYGQVKCQFHWDSHGKANQDSSCWIRVAQSWAGNKLGAFYLPRVGQEVIVEFLEGDPDRPIITGGVYNGANMPPYDPSKNKTISTLKSRSSPYSGGFNELRFQDQQGKEQIFIHAEKNLDIRVKNDALKWVGNNRHMIVQQDNLEHIKKNLHKIVGKNRLANIAGDDHLKVIGEYCIEAKKVVIVSTIGITFKCGDNHVTIDESGITIKGSVINLDGGLVKIACEPGSLPLQAEVGDATPAGEADNGEISS